MAIQSVDGKLHPHDVQAQRLGNGTITDSHIQHSGLTPNAINNVISTFDQRINYGGTWNHTMAGSQEFLAEKSYSSVPQSTLTINFTGTSIAILGDITSDGGRADIKIDGVSALGSVSASGMVAFEDPDQHLELSATATTIFVAGSPTVMNNFSTPGTIRIGQEEITYLVADAGTSSFTGCTRGANDTAKAIHPSGDAINRADSIIDFYSPYPMGRITVWAKGNLAPGAHTLTLSVRLDSNPSSSGNLCTVTGLVVGGMLGAPNINTNFRYIDVGPATTDAFGRLGPFTLTTDIANEQFLTPIGCAPVANCHTAYPMWDTSGNFYVVTDAGSMTAAVEAIVYTLNLGPSI